VERRATAAEGASTPSRRRPPTARKAACAALSLLVAWVVVVLAWALWTRPWVVTTPALGTGWDDLGAMALLVGAFAAIGWVAVALPLITLGNHGGWFFRPLTAPLIGAVCGVAILLTEFAFFFDYPPWDMLADRGDVGVVSMVGVAALFGATLWWTYTLAVRGREFSGDRTPGLRPVQDRAPSPSQSANE